MKKLTQQQLAVIKMIIARFKSKSPKGYRILLSICATIASIMGLYVLLYAADLFPGKWEPVSGKVNDVLVVLGAAFSALGIGAASTTTDPELMSKDTKDAVIKDITDNHTDL